MMPFRDQRVGDHLPLLQRVRPIEHYDGGVVHGDRVCLPPAVASIFA